MFQFLVTLTKEMALGVALAAPIALMLATYDQWFPILKEFIQ